MFYFSYAYASVTIRCLEQTLNNDVLNQKLQLNRYVSYKCSQISLCCLCKEKLKSIYIDNYLVTFDVETFCSKLSIKWSSIRIP